MKQQEDVLQKIHKIINEPGMTWKVRRALLRSIGVDEKSIKSLVPEPPQGKDFHASDY